MTETTTDPLTDEQKAEMADHFSTWEHEYRNEPQNHEVVHEDADVIILADHTGHELNEWASDFGVSRGELSRHWHATAREKCDYSFSVSDPIIFPNPE